MAGWPVQVTEYGEVLDEVPIRFGVLGVQAKVVKFGEEQ